MKSKLPVHTHTAFFPPTAFFHYLPFFSLSLQIKVFSQILVSLFQSSLSWSRIYSESFWCFVLLACVFCFWRFVWFSSILLIFIKLCCRFYLTWLRWYVVNFAQGFCGQFIGQTYWLSVARLTLKVDGSAHFLDIFLSCKFVIQFLFFLHFQKLWISSFLSNITVKDLGKRFYQYF